MNMEISVDRLQHFFETWWAVMPSKRAVFPPGAGTWGSRA